MPFISGLWDPAGISYPCEEPENPDLVLDTGEKNLEECVEAVLGLLMQQGVINKKDT